MSAVTPSLQGITSQQYKIWLESRGIHSNSDIELMSAPSVADMKTAKRQTLSITSEASSGSAPDKEQQTTIEDAKSYASSKKVIVKFYLNAYQVVARTYPNLMTLSEVKDDIGHRFQVKPNLLLIKQCNQILSDNCMVEETDKNEYGIHEYDLSLDNKDTNCNYNKPQLNLDVYYSKQRLPNFITVNIAAEDCLDGIAKTLIVEIENKSILKPLLCAYRHIISNIEYLDAFTQTGPYFDKHKYRYYVSRDVQTYEHKPKLIDTCHEHSTQCFLDGNNILEYSEATDYFIQPGKYQTYAQIERMKDKIGKLRLIQRNYRRAKWMRWMKECAQEYRRLVNNRIADEEEFKAEQQRLIDREANAKQHPRSKDDFDLLLLDIQQWKLEEMNRINSMYEGVARIPEIHILLNKEIELLNNLEKQKRDIYKSMADMREDKLLQKLGEPIKWFGYADTIIKMDSLRTQRARYLTEIYHELRENRPKEERLQLINKVQKILLEESNFPDFPQLFELFDREKNLLIYSSNCDVEILRKRENLLFIELIKYDEEAKPKRTGSRMCKVCKRVKTYSKFAIRTRQYAVDTCNSCYYLKAQTTDSIVLHSLLRSIQREERKKRCSGSIAFVMQMEDVRYLLMKIWHGHSILNKCEDLKRLRFPRWVKNEEWSPWNCVCLTDEEARNHERIEDLEGVYDKNLIMEVGNRHKVARSSFHKLAAVATEFTESGRWWKIGLNPQRIVKLEHISDYKSADDVLNKNVPDRNYTGEKII